MGLIEQFDDVGKMCRQLFLMFCHAQRILNQAIHGRLGNACQAKLNDFLAHPANKIKQVLPGCTNFMVKIN